MEYQIEGVVGEDGVFCGKVKVFGYWIEGVVEFELFKGFYMLEWVLMWVGLFDIYIVLMEFEQSNFSYSCVDYICYFGLVEEFVGLMIYCDGLCVLFYGCEDNDFFEIEYKCSKNVGCYFWNYRQMFGRIVLIRYNNLNLKDKVGWEGFIDNMVVKIF